MPEAPKRQIPPAVLAALCLLPALQSAVAVHFQWWTEVTYPLLKGAILAAPLIVWKFTGRERGELAADIGLTMPTVWRGLAGGAVFGGVILAMYYLVLARVVDPGAVQAKAHALGVREPMRYWSMAAFISLGNSAIEEYYWRGFLVGQFRRLVRVPTEVCLYGGLLFGVHHVFVLAGSFPVATVALAVTGTVIAGGAWTFLRLRGWSLWDLWLCHLLADLAAFVAGWDMVRPRL